MLAGRVAVVLGGESAIGTQCADALMESEAKVALISTRCSVRMNQLLKCGTPAQIACWICDVADSQIAKDCLKSVRQIWGLPTILVNVLTTCAADHQASRDRAMVLSKYFLNDLQHNAKAGALINVLPPVTDEIIGNGLETYGEEMKRLTEHLALRLAPEGISVNLVQPGRIRGHEESHGDQRYDIPAGRLGRPDEVAWAVKMLASPAAQYITGTVLRVDGGWSLKEYQPG
jgi:NAD(P)-dependent dehydrogenase (short-subunit alcohol dehydrogenase family)